MAAMADATHFAWFKTPIGDCGIAWGEAGVCGLMLPGASRERTLASLRRRHARACEGAPTVAIAEAITAVQSLLSGQRTALDFIVLDLSGVPDFHRRVYEAARRIEAGRTCTYGDLAEELGEPGAARAVGQALGANPFAIIVPCHRVLAAGGASGGFSAPGGVDTKLRLLEIERARFGVQPSLFDAP
jgi:methylated-DNA-[protein]-cysteine S-methyltransferase